MLTTATSTSLLVGCRQGDEQAWQRLHDRYEPMLIAFARRSGFSAEEARDVVQETMMAFLTTFREGRFDPEKGRVRSWLKGIAVNKVREASRRRRVRREVQVHNSQTTDLLDRIPDENTLTDIFEQEWECGVLRECLREVRQKVDEQTFRAFELYARHGRSPNDVAEELGISVNAVYLAKSRVLSHVRDISKDMVDTW